MFCDLLYLISALKQGNDKLSLPLDPVARFHLRNGASCFRINYMANPAKYGLETSAGLMVNYKYERDINLHEDNIVKFLETSSFPLGHQVQGLLNL
jgi:malonyl-CoA decarboxylase